MEEEETTVVDTKTIISKNTKRELVNICKDLEEKGYESVKQIVAYLISGDPGYISNYKECRNRITRFQREEILELMITNFIKK